VPSALVESRIAAAKTTEEETAMIRKVPRRRKVTTSDEKDHYIRWLVELVVLFAGRVVGSILATFLGRH
jgi:hypothetical protein